MPGERTIRVELAWSESGTVRRAEFRIHEGATIAEAIRTALGQGLLDESRVAGAEVAVFGKRRAPDEILRDGDRIELPGPLKVDPKLARQRRVAHRRAAQERDKWRGGG